MSSHAELIEKLKSKYPNNPIFELVELVDRKDFIPGLNSIDAYEDRPVSIGEFQNSLSPSIIVEMCELLDLREGQVVLEIGMGSGYMTSCVYRKITLGRIITIERIKTLCSLGQQNLKKKYKNSFEEKKIRVFWEDGLTAHTKFPENYFDRIYFTCSIDLHKFNLDGFVKLLKPEGILVFPADKNILYSYI